MRVAPSCCREEAEALIADSEAIISSDRWWAYDHLEAGPALLVASRATSAITPRAHSPTKRSSARPASGSPRACLRAGAPSRQMAIAAAGAARSARLSASCASSERGRRKSVKTRYHRGLARNLSRPGPGYGPFSSIPAWSRPTTAPSAACATRSSTASLSQGSRCERGRARDRASARGFDHAGFRAAAVRLPRRGRPDLDPRRACAGARWSRSMNAHRNTLVSRHFFEWARLVSNEHGREWCEETSPWRPSGRWARLVSNQRPLACEASALPLSYAPGGRMIGSPGWMAGRGLPGATGIPGRVGSGQPAPTCRPWFDWTRPTGAMAPPRARMAA